MPVPTSAALNALFDGVTAVHVALWAIAAGMPMSRANANTAVNPSFLIDTALLLSQNYASKRALRARKIVQVRCAFPSENRAQLICARCNTVKFFDARSRVRHR